MLIASLLAGVALAASDGDPDGVVTTAPTNAPTLAQALAAAPEASLTAPTAQDAAPHGMTTEQQISCAQRQLMSLEQMAVSHAGTKSRHQQIIAGRESGKLQQHLIHFAITGAPHRDNL